MKEYYFLEVLPGMYFVNFKNNKKSLVYTVNHEEAWRTSSFQSASKMSLCLSRLYNISTIVVYSNRLDNNKV